MDKHQRFTLREVYEAALTYKPGLTYATLYNRLNYLRRHGKLPPTATTSSLTWEQVRLILSMRRAERRQPRQAAVNILRQQMRNDGLA